MNKEERRRKFHEALNQMLYTPPPSSSSSSSSHPHPSFNFKYPNISDFDQIPDELEEFGSVSLSSSEDERERGPQKLSRAQRKRVRKRKKKMKEDASRRNGMIGPLLPLPGEPKGVRRNASQNSCIENERPGEAAPCTNQSKLKHRRRAKKLAKEKSESTITEKSQQNCDPFSNKEA